MSRPFVDITDQRFGKLLVVDKTEKRLGTSIVWECKCDCGVTSFTYSKKDFLNHINKIYKYSFE